MHTFYLRSSSYGCYEGCQLKFFLDYVLNFASPPHSTAASVGSITHKCLELLSRKKLAIQNNQTSFTDPELGEFHIDQITDGSVMDIAYPLEVNKTKHLYQWGEPERQHALNSFNNALSFNDGQYHPLRQTIFAPETFFDFEIKKPWAWYSFKMPDGTTKTGYLRLRGTMDLLIKVSDDTLEYCDYKSGKTRKDFFSGKLKDYNSLQYDAQLLIYFLAIKHLFPQYKLITSIFFLNAGGVFSLDFNEEHVKRAERMIEKWFTKVRNNWKPSHVFPSYKCKTCWFANHDGPEHDPGNIANVVEYKDSFCSKMRGELTQLGYDRVFANHFKSGSEQNYSGGGKVIVVPQSE